MSFGVFLSLWTTGIVAFLLFFVATFMVISGSVTIGNFAFGISTDVNSGDVDDTFAIAYVVTKGFFVDGYFSYARAVVRWFTPFVQPYTIRVALHSEGDIQLLLGQLKDQMYGPVTCVSDGFLTANYELIEVYQAGCKVVFPRSNQFHYELVTTRGMLRVQLLEIAGPTSCVFNTTRQLMYVGRLSVQEWRVDHIAGANAKELSKKCIEKALHNGARVGELPLQFSRHILCSLGSHSPMLAVAAQLQLNPWAFSFLQCGVVARQFAESNQENGAVLLTKMGLTYDALWEKLDYRVRTQVTDFAAKFSDWDAPNDVVRNRILWAVVNFGGKFPWRSESLTSVSPPFIDLCSILKIERSDMTPLELFGLRVRNVASFTGETEVLVAEILSHTVLFDLYSMVLLKYNLSAEKVARDPKRLAWFNHHVQQFVDSLNSLTK